MNVTKHRDSEQCYLRRVLEGNVSLSLRLQDHSTSVPEKK